MTNPQSASSATPPPASLKRHHLRAIGRDEMVDVAEFLPPGATWLPAPQHAVPTLPGHPPMIGYLVLVPAEQQGRPTTVSAVAAPAPGPSASAQEASAEVLGDGLPVRVYPVQRTAEVDGVRLDLTYLEFELLAHLVAHPHRVHSRDQLVTTVWGYGHVGDGRTVDVHIARLRRKLGAEHRQVIQTVRRVGYKYAPVSKR
ncbi:winged helix-turn-helix domain-containing protein [Streptomyces cavernicola]|uniref:Winged helix-turn-helix domain-containing protein n=1 Tax=Streptomyces cavernicola TaxID=3043613 RepID=A0ABT6S6T0_9ACTN|nr:winged helix-turn-helix domain-containing protein [Streptomyces sp. B-S-A6]MDI3403148.1 winged helix-turn-helix domain-containing protein [Streptomyces sp. B-S-A6]